jgi:hypothetical protein
MEIPLTQASETKNRVDARLNPENHNRTTLRPQLSDYA